MRKKSKVITVLFAFVFVFMLQTVTNASEGVSKVAAHSATTRTILPDGSYKTDTEIIIEPSISGAFTGAAAGAIAGGIAGWIFGSAY